MITLMRNETDCEIAALSTASGRSYDEVNDAFLVGDCGPLTNPARGNPVSVYAAVARIGLWKRNLTWADLAERKAKPEKTVILVHNASAPTLQQHWVVLAGYTTTGFLCFWGDREEPRHVQTDIMKHLFLDGWPDCAFEVMEGTWWNRFKIWLGIAMLILMATMPFEFVRSIP